MLIERLVKVCEVMYNVNAKVKRRLILRRQQILNSFPARNISVGPGMRVRDLTTDMIGMRMNYLLYNSYSYGMTVHFQLGLF